MNVLTYSPRTLNDALAWWTDHPDATLLAGGTDILVRLRDALVWPPLLDLTQIEELRGIDLHGGRVRIGALATYTQIETNASVCEHAGVLAQAARLVGSPQIRNRGTIGGNLANASPAGDTLPALFVLEATLDLVSATGTRRVPIATFFTGPGKTLLQPQELIAGVTFAPVPGARGVFLRLGQRRALAISKVSLALLLTARAGRIADLRIALGAVAPTVIRAPRTEAALRGAALAHPPLDSARAAVQEEAVPITDIRSEKDYRREMCAVLLERALQRLS